SHISLPSSTKPLGILLAVVTSSCHALLPASPNAAERSYASISSGLDHPTAVAAHAGMANAMRSRCNAVNCLESRSPSKGSTRTMSTAATPTATGPARAPRPTSSMPAITVPPQESARTVSTEKSGTCTIRVQAPAQMVDHQNLPNPSDPTARQQSLPGPRQCRYQQIRHWDHPCEHGSRPIHSGDPPLPIT